MSHIPNISFREAMGLGAVGTLGHSDAASPDNPLVPLRSPGAIDRCTAADVSHERPLGFFMVPEDAAVVLRDGLDAGQAGQAAQAYRLPKVAGTPAKMTQKDFELAAAALKCEVAAIKAVAEVEARGSGFFPDGRPKILFEAHHFSRLTKRVWDKLYPHISAPKWKKELYLGGAKEYRRLEEAITLDAHAAIQSASWGAFQIMGFNYKAVGAGSPEDFVAGMYAGEGSHLMAFVGFVNSMGLAKSIQGKDWASFAKGYNGPRYKENDYDGKLAKAYAKYATPAALKPPARQ